MSSDGPEPARPAKAADDAVVTGLSTPNPPSIHHSVPPPLIPDHELLRCIGRGSYGEVWLARNVLGTLRAVKIVRRSAFEEDKPFQREFHGIQKFEPISRSHEGLVGILQVGANETEGWFYYVMELADSVSSLEFRVSGSTPAVPANLQLETPNSKPETYVPRTLRSDVKRRGALPPAECIAIGLSLARALARLHAHKLVHRDIKPSNIIFIGGAPRLADIGLVTDLDATRTYVGTEGFMPPEGPGTPQADLYALGKVLYEMATGKDRQEYPDLPTALGVTPHPPSGHPLPCEGRGQGEGCVAANPQSANPIPGAFERSALLELNEIFTKACASDPRQRYQSAEELLADLELVSAGKSVKQRHSNVRRWKFALRTAVLAAVGTAVAIGLGSLRHSRPQPLDPLTTGRNVGGYPPNAMRGTTNTEAWNHYRLGYHAVRRSTEESDRQAIEQFNRAIELDPKFALAYFGLWRSKYPGAFRLTAAQSNDWQRLSDKLVELDPGLAETHVPLGFARWREWKWREAEAEFREALRLNPDCLPAWVALGFFLAYVGRTDEALQALDRGQLVDPNWPALGSVKGQAHFVQRRFQTALELCLETARREPLFPLARRFSARAYFALTNYPTAIDELEQSELLQGRLATNEVKQEFAELRRAFQEGGVRGYWLKQLELTGARWQPDEYPYAFAQIHAQLGDKKQALAFLERACEQHDELVFLTFDECWDPWRDEPRFEAVRQQVGLPRHPSFPAK